MENNHPGGFNPKATFFFPILINKVNLFGNKGMNLLPSIWGQSK